MTRSFWSGSTRAKIVVRCGSRRRTPGGSGRAISSPVRTPSTSRPTCARDGPRDDLAVAGHDLEGDAESTEVGEGGADVGLRWVAEQEQALEHELGLVARLEARSPAPRSGLPTAIARSPSVAAAVMRASICARCSASSGTGPSAVRTLVDRSRIASGAPFVTSSGEPSGRATRIAKAPALRSRRAARRACDRPPRPPGRRSLASSAMSSGLVKPVWKWLLSHARRERIGCVVAVGPDRALEREPPLGERAGLVGAQDRHAAEVLDRGQALDEHAAPGERAGPAAQVDRDDRRQELGRQADRERDGEQQRLDERTLEGDIGREDPDDEQQDDPRHEEAEASHPALEVVASACARSAGGR